MRTQMFGSSLVLAAALVGCGGDDGGTQIMLPDAATVMVDAPPAPRTCAVDMAGFQAGSIGTQQMRQTGDFIEMPTMGPQMGKTVFTLAVGLPGSTQQVADILAIEVVKGTSGFTTGSAVTYSTDATAANYVAASYILGDFNRTSGNAANFYWATSGSVTLSAIGESNGNPITGSATATNYGEIDTMTGAPIAGGCTTSVAGLTFYLTQMASQARVDDGAGGTFSPDEMRRIADTIQRYKLAK